MPSTDYQWFLRKCFALAVYKTPLYQLMWLEVWFCLYPTFCSCTPVKNPCCIYTLVCFCEFRIHPHKQNVLEVVTPLRVFYLQVQSFVVLISMRQHICRVHYMLSPIVCLSVCLSVTRLDQSKTVEVRIVQFSPYSYHIPIVFAGYVSSRNSDGFPEQAERGRQTRLGWGKQATF